MEKVFKKLCATKGEILIETLCAVFIIGIACGVFASMIVAATKMNEVALSADQRLYTELSTAEKHTESTSATVTVSWTDGASTFQTFKVNKTGSSGQLMSYVWAGS